MTHRTQRATPQCLLWLLALLCWCVMPLRAAKALEAPPGGDPAAGGDAPVTARVSDVAGGLTVRGDGEDDYSPIEVNATLRDGDPLWTAARGRGEIELGPGSWARLAEDAKVQIRHLPPDSELRLW